MRKAFAFCLSCVLMAMGICGCSSAPAKQPRKTEFPDNAFKEVPQEYFKYSPESGLVVQLTYETKFYAGNGEKFEKRCLVYLPYGYDSSDKDTKYNVLYYMHGGGGSEKELLYGVMEDSPAKLMLDNMIYNGDMEPCIVVNVSYNSPVDGDLWSQCGNFWQELVNDCIPAVETEYNTYLEKATRKGIRDSRLHRAFGGFSMGSATTWWTFDNALAEIAYYLPISGDSWGIEQAGGANKPKETAERLRQKVIDQGFTWEDFYIYCGTGTNDIAYPNMCPMVEEMKKLDDTFKWCDNFKDGNFYYAVRDGGWHDQNTVYRIIYNGLPKFFG